MRRRLSTFPIHKPFERLKPTASISQLALRLVVDFYSHVPEVVGTATTLCGHFLVTAKHVLDDYCDVESVASPEASIDVNRSLSAVQLLPGPEYLVWDVVSAIFHPASDIALLRVSPNPARSHHDGLHRWKSPIVNPFAPNVDERVAAFGYRRSRVRASKNSKGGLHIDLDDELMSSVGRVQEIHEWGRDKVMLPFPCYQVSARFDDGMSGGPVFDEYGSLCGIVCSNFGGSDEYGEPISNVTMLWPLFTLILDADRGDNYPRGIRYPAIELARDGQIRVSEFSRLSSWFATHIRPEVNP